jgi:hypothetical protein
MSCRSCAPGSPAGWAGERRPAWPRGQQGPTWLPWFVPLVTFWGLAGASLLLRLPRGQAAEITFELAERIGWGAYPTVGAVIVARQPRNPIGWLRCGIGLVLGPAFFGQAYAWYAPVHRPGSLPGGLAMAWLGQWPWYLALGLVTRVLLLFTNGRLVSPLAAGCMGDRRHHGCRVDLGRPCPTRSRGAAWSSWPTAGHRASRGGIQAARAACVADHRTAGGPGSLLDGQPRTASLWLRPPARPSPWQEVEADRRNRRGPA